MTLKLISMVWNLTQAGIVLDAGQVVAIRSKLLVLAIRLHRAGLAPDVWFVE